MLLRHALGDLLADLAQRRVGAPRDQPRQIGRQRADGGRDRHLVVVEDDDQPRVHRAGVVHRLIGHAGRHRAVADHRDHVALLAGEIARDRHAEAGRDRGGGMRGAEAVVFALGALGETGETAAHAQRTDTVAPAGQDLVRIGLMADVPDDAVVGRVEHVVQRAGQFHDAEPGAEMPAGHRDGVDHFGAQFVGNLRQVFLVDAAQVSGGLDCVQQRRL